MICNRAVLACTLVLVLVLLISVRDIDARKTSRRGGSSGGSFGLKSRSTPKSKPQPQQQQQSHSGSNPGTIGWNVPSNQKPAGSTGTAGSSTYPKASAPNEHVSKTSATNVQSGYPGSNTGGYGNPPPYSPSGGYHGGAPPAYNPSSSGGYHGGAPPAYSPSGSGGYHGGAPPAYGGYHGGYNPSYGNGHGFSSQPGQGYNPSYGHSAMGAAQPQTVILQSQGSRPGIGQLAKEAFVFAGVSAGVNAAVNRILPGGIYGHSPSYGASSSGVVPPVSHTQITYNNYYNNGTGEAQPGAAVAAPVPPSGPAAAAPAPAAPDAPPAAPAAPADPAAAPAAAEPANNQQQQQQQQNQNAPSPLGFIISDAELQKMTEDLFAKDTNNAFKHITVKLQGQKTDDSVTDDATENLLEVKSEAWEIPTIKAVLALHDNYELDVKTKETVSAEERKEESDLLDAFVATDVMKATMKYLAEKGYVPDDEYEFKDTLKRIWFSQFKRIDGEPSSSGFETIFLAEKFDNEIIGLHDWIYFSKQEEAKKLDYLGYIKKLDLGTNGMIIKGRSKLNDIVQPITTIFVGTSPELEMALYTLCFYTRPNNVCPVAMGGANFLIVANRVNYFGKDILISAFPDI